MRKSIKPRKQPVQERGQKRVDDILDALASLIAEEGVEAVTTRRVGERASVPVGSIYQFFPNKYALLNALSKRYLDRISEILQRFTNLQDIGMTWDEAVEQSIDALAEFWRLEKAAYVLWMSTQHLPEMRESDARSIARDATFIAESLRVILPCVSDEDRLRVARTNIAVSNALLNLSIEVDELEGRKIIEHLKLILRQYVRALPGARG